MAYKLSSELKGHESDVRAVVAASDDCVFSTSRDSTARQWVHGGANWEAAAVYAGYHEGFVNSAAYAHVQGTDYILTGGQDAIIQAWPITSATKDQRPAYTLLGHALNVCCLDADKNGRIVSGSWDMTVKIWRNFQLETTLTGHSQAVWAVLAIEPSASTQREELTLTASADKLIKLFKGKNDTATTTFKGHSQPVRALARLGEDRFASAGNDGTIRIWSLDGSALATLDGHDSFVYSLAPLPDGSLVSGGEDRSVRVWSASDGQCVQVIILPAISVWSVASTNSGDIVAGASDGVVRMFTRRKERMADEDTLKSYDASVSATAINSTQVGDVKKADLPGLEALQRDGKKEGEVIMVKNGLNVEAHQWSTADNTWTKIGDVVDAVGSGRKQLHKGVEYDYVFDVDVKEGSPPLKLPYNANQNPWDAAQRFLQENELPAEYADQVVEFIERNAGGVSLGSSGNADPFTGAGSYRAAAPNGNRNSEPFGGDPYTGSGSYRPPVASSASSGKSGARLLPHRTPLTFTQANLPALVNKLQQFNEQLASTSASQALSAEELGSLDRLPNAPSIAVLRKLVDWPAVSRFPGLDLVRILSLPEELLDPVLSNLQQGEAGPKEAETNKLLALRALANGLARGGFASTTAAEKVLATLTRLDIAAQSKNSKTALATVALNFSILAVQNKLTSGGSELISVLSALLGESDAEVGYRSLLACGNVLLSTGLSGSVTPEMAQSLQAKAIDAGTRFTEPRAQQLVAEVAQL